jgi:DNA-binding CsgD family transcriptional regulator
VAVPFGVLNQWGAATSDVGSPVLAAQRLREILDERPTLLVADDLQWCDPESVTALLEVLTRVEGDRLLVVVATRPLPPTQHQAWQRWCERSDRVERLPLAGLDLDTAVAVVRERQPGIDLVTARALWEHTAGNPLHLTALIAEYEPGELARARQLPAPSAFAAAIVAALARLPVDAIAAARAIAVVGDQWSPLPVVAELAELSELSVPVQQLVDAGLLQLRPSAAAPAVRISHALTRAAIYQDTPLPIRHKLHARAAHLVTGRAGVLDHRLAATERFDDVLADDLDAYAQGLHQQRSYRLASHYLAAASGVTRDPVARERRWLESLFDALMAGDRRGVRAELGAIVEAGDGGRRGLVAGTLAIWERRHADGIAALEAARASEGVDAVTAYRLDVLLAWGRLMIGAPAEAIRAALQRAGGRDHLDGSVRRLAVLCEGQLATRSATGTEPLATVADLPTHPASVPVEATAALAWRGILLTSVGQFADGAGDLRELIERMHKGLADFGSGSFHALLARCQWFTGDWPMARLNARLALDLSGEYPHPIVAAIIPLIAIGEGDLATADTELRAAHDQIDAAPWVEAVDLLDISDVAREHAAGTNRAAAYSSFRSSVAAIRSGRQRKNIVWSLHAGLAAIWGRQFDDALTCISVLESATSPSAWAPPAAKWLRGLAAEADGDGKSALIALRSAVASAPSEMPLYAAHIHVDHARVAHLLGDPSAASRSLAQAAGIYRRLQASCYLDRLEALQQKLTAAPVHAVDLGLSDRERDVLTLLTAGMSYVQIAASLFITKGTVSFHLSRIYAKTNVSSRHQLTELVHADPAAFGLT